MLTICTFLWGDKYSPVYVERLAAGLRRHLIQRYRLLCLTERERKIDLPAGVERHAIKDPELCQIKGCFARLRLFDPGWQGNRGIRTDDRIACIDLDAIITGPLDPLFDRDDSFTILCGANQSNPNPMNGSLWMLRAGHHANVWTDFSLEAAQDMPRYDFPDDQGWFWWKMPYAARWECGPSSGIWSFRKRGWPADDMLPAGARLVAFPGKRDPSQFTHLDWVKTHWQ